MAADRSTILSRSARAGRGVFRHRFGRGNAAICVSYAVTFRCTNACSYCDLPPAGDELDFERSRPLIDALADAGMVRLGFTGGEPLLHPDIGRLIRHCRETGIATVLSTNGVLVGGRIDEIADVELVSVSLDGGAGVHDAARGGNCFDHAWNAVEVLRGRGVPIVVSAVLNARNVGHVDELVSLADEAGATTVWQPYFRPGEPPADGDPNRPDAAAFRAAIDKILRIKRERPRLVASSRPYLRFVRDHYPAHDPAGCMAGQLYFGLSPDGQLHRCYPMIGRSPGVAVTPTNVAQAIRKYVSPECPASCYCNGHLENNFLFGFHPLSMWDVLTGYARMTRRPTSR